MTFADSEKLSFPFIYFEAWLSLVERCVRDAEVVGSNPVASTNKKPEIPQGISVFLFVNTTESNWQGICAAEGVDARSATTGAERRTNPVASIAGNPVKQRVSGISLPIFLMTFGAVW